MTAFGGSLGGAWTKPLSVEERERKWRLLEAAFTKALQGEGLKDLSYEELYRTGHELVSKQCGEYLYRGTRRWFENVCADLAERLGEVATEDLPQAFYREFERYEAATMIIADVLLYMDKNFCNQRNEPDTQVLASMQFRTRVFELSPVGRRITQVFLDAMRRLRTAPDLNVVAKDPDLVAIQRLVVSVLATDKSTRRMDAYIRYVQEPLSQATDDFFREDVRYARANLRGLPLLSYVHKRTVDEPVVLHAMGIREPTVLSHHQKLVTQHWTNTLIDTLLNNDDMSLGQIFRRNDIQNGRMLWEILSRSQEGLLGVNCRYREVLEGAILECMSAKERAKVCVDNLTNLRAKHVDFVRKCMDTDSSLMSQMAKALSNASQHYPVFSQKLVGAMNEVLVGLQTGKTASESPDEALQVVQSYGREAILEPFQALQNHDTFEYHYRLHLVSRVLEVIGRRYVEDNPDSWAQSAIDLEREAIKLYRGECGEYYVAKLKGFLDDIILSRDCANGYEDCVQVESERTGHELPGALRPVVVATTQWMRGQSETPSINFDHLPEMSLMATGFEMYYRTVHEHRRLKWLIDQGRAIVRFRPQMGQSTYTDLSCTTIQLSCLLLFNEHEQLSWKTIRELLGLPQENVSSVSVAKRQVMGLYCKSTHAVLKLLAERETRAMLSDEDVLEVNWDFRSDRRRLQCPILASKALKARRDGDDGRGNVTVTDQGEEVPETSTETLVRVNEAGVPHAVEMDRQRIVEAAIVRLMKARRTMSHSALIAAVNEEVERWKFIPAPQFVKDRIEELINREYILRDPDDPRNYQYIT